MAMRRASNALARAVARTARSGGGASSGSASRGAAAATHAGRAGRLPAGSTAQYALLRPAAPFAARSFWGTSSAAGAAGDAEGAKAQAEKRKQTKEQEEQDGTEVPVAEGEGSQEAGGADGAGAEDAEGTEGAEGDRTAEGAEDEADEALVAAKAEVEALSAQLADTKDRMLRVAAEAENVRQRSQRQLDDGKKYAIQGFAKELMEVRCTAPGDLTSFLQAGAGSCPPPARWLAVNQQSTNRLRCDAQNCLFLLLTRTVIDRSLHSPRTRAQVADNLQLALDAVPEEHRAAEGAEPGSAAALLVSLHEGVRMVDGQLLRALGKHGVEKVNPMGDAFDPNEHEALFEMPDADKEAGTVAHVQKPGYKLHGRVVRPAQVGVTRKP